MIKLGELEVDILNRTVRTGASELRLASLEQNLLYLLAANAGRVVTREEISTGMGADYVVESNVVDRQIRDLRAVARQLEAAAVHFAGAEAWISVSAIRQQ